MIRIILSTERERERENDGGFFNVSRLKRKFISSGNGLRTCNHLFFHDHSWNEAGKYKPLPPFEITMMEHKKKELYIVVIVV